MKLEFYTIKVDEKFLYAQCNGIPMVYEFNERGRLMAEKDKENLELKYPHQNFEVIKLGEKP